MFDVAHIVRHADCLYDLSKDIFLLLIHSKAVLVLMGFFKLHHAHSC